MAMTTDDVTVFLDLLERDQQATARLRDMVLPHDQLGRIERSQTELVETQEAMARNLSRLDSAMADLAEAQKVTAQRVDELAQAQTRTEIALKELTGEHIKSRNQLADVRGTSLELYYRDHLPSFLGKHLAKTQVVMPYSILEQIEPRLTPQSVADLLLIDVLVRGVPRQQPGANELWLVIEVSSVIDKTDVERATKRASLLRTAGLAAIPAVAGSSITQGAKTAVAKEGGVTVVRGRVLSWPDQPPA